MDSRETTPAEDSQLDDEKEEEIASNANWRRNPMRVSLRFLLAASSYVRFVGQAHITTTAFIAHVSDRQQPRKDQALEDCYERLSKNVNCYLLLQRYH